MTRQQNPNLRILEQAVAALGPLAEKLVFLGGCATGLLITDPAAPRIRATKDVDVITEVASLQQYHALGQQLRAQGFVEDQSKGAPICRWTGSGVLLDVMPTDARILGFGNEFYKPAMAAAKLTKLPSNREIRMVTAPWFLMTKLAAFASRGSGDYTLSHDMEDIIAVVDGRPELIAEVAQVEESLQQNLAQHFAGLLANDSFRAALPGHLPPEISSPSRLPLILERITAIASGSSKAAIN